MDKISSKIQIPIKTKIASRIMIYIGLMVVVAFLFFIFDIYKNHPITQCPVGALCDNVDYWQLFYYFAPMFMIIPFAGLLLFGGIGLLFLKKIGWWLGALSVLLFDISYGFVMFAMFLSIENLIIIFIWPLVLAFVAFLLLILDRKNYFAAVEKAKKGDGGAA